MLYGRTKVKSTRSRTVHVMQAVADQLAEREADIHSATAARDAASQELDEAKSAYLKATEVHLISLAPDWDASDSKHMSDTIHGMQCTDTNVVKPS